MLYAVMPERVKNFSSHDCERVNYGRGSKTVQFWTDVRVARIDAEERNGYFAELRPWRVCEVIFKPVER